MRRRKRVNRIPQNRFNWIHKIDIFKYLSLLLIFFFVISIPTIIKKLIKVTKIECTSQHGKCPQELESEIKNYESSDYKNAKSGLENLFNGKKNISSFMIQYKIPSTIKIDLLLKVPRYAIKNKSFLLIDKSGLILEESDTSKNLPTLNYYELNSSLGSIVSDKIFFSLKLIEKISIINSISSSEIKNDSLEILLENGILVRMPLEGDIDVLAGSLKLIFSRLNEVPQGIKMVDTISISDVREIDLRFKNPVIR